MIHKTLLIIKLGITHVYKHIPDACCLFPAQTFIPYSTVRLDGIKEERVKKINDESTAIKRSLGG